jgi:hypothetical protein
MTGIRDRDINKEREPRRALAKRFERLNTGETISAGGLNENK